QRWRAPCIENPAMNPDGERHVLNLEEIDLESLAMMLRERFGNTLEEDYLDGRTVLRDAVCSHLGCSSLEAEELVDTLEAREYVRFPRLVDDTHPSEGARWLIGDP